MSEGKAKLTPAPTATALADLISAMPSAHAIGLGVPKNTVLAPNQAFAITTVGRPHDPATVKTRSLADFHFAPGQPAWCLLDFDTKGMPDQVKGRLEVAGGFEAALAGCLPELATTARVIRNSTSSGIRNTETGETYPGSGGIHLYLLGADGADIPRFIDALFDRLWLAGYGWIVVSAAGSMLVRTLIDAAVGSPGRLVFEALRPWGRGSNRTRRRAWLARRKGWRSIP
jgi:hypothetical protein